MSDNPFDALDSSASGDNPFDALAPAVAGPVAPPSPKATGGVRSLVGKNFNRLTDLLARPSEANLARHVRGAGLQTLIHGESPEQYQSDTRSAERDLDAVSKAHGLAVNANRKPWEQAAYDAGVQTLYDPTLVGGKLGAGERLGAMAEAHGLPLALRAGNSIEYLASRLAGDKGRQIASDLGHLPAALHDLFGVDSTAKRALAKSHGSKWTGLYAGAASARQAGENMSSAIAGTFHRQYQDAIKDMSDRDYLVTVRAINSGKVGLLPQRLRPAAQRIESIFDAMHYVGGTKQARAALGGVADFAKPFDQGILGTRKATQFRERYHPVPPSGESVPDPATVSAAAGFRRGQRQVVNPLTFKNPNLLQRSGEARIIADPELYKDAAAQAFENFGREYGGAISKRMMKQVFGAKRAGQVPQAIRGQQISDFSPAELDALTPRQRMLIRRNPGQGGMFARPFLPDEAKTRLQKALDVAKKVTDYGKSAYFFMPFPHEANVSSLLALKNPALVPKAIALHGKLMKMSPDQRLAELSDAIKAGALSLRNTERQTPFIEGLSHVGTGDKSFSLKRDWANPTKYANALARGTENLYRTSSEHLWTFDDAAKATLYRNLVSNGMTPARAAHEVSATMIDYAHRSPAAEASRAFVPFATYRSKMPAAVMRSTLRHPENAAFMSRAAPALGGNTQSTGSGDVRNYLPLAEIARLAEPPRGGVDYLRSSAGPIARALLGAADVSPSSYRGKHYFTYGANPLLYGLTETTPAVGALADMSNLGPVSGRHKGQTTLKKRLESAPQAWLENLVHAMTRTYPMGSP